MVVNWKYIRIILLIIIVASTFYTQPTLEKDMVPPVKFTELFFIFFGSIFMIIFVIGMQTMNKRQNHHEWLEISWNTNPFLLKQPIQFFHYGGWIMFVSYILPTINTYIKYPEYTLNGILPLCAGLGMVIGSYICSYLFVNKDKLNN